MKILHTSDWHLGKSLGGHPLDADQRYALEKVKLHLTEVQYDLVILAGDVFDRATPPPDAARMLGAWLGDVHAVAPSLPIVIVAGNHDNGPRLAWTASLLDRQNVYLRGDADRIDEPILVTGRDGVEAEVWALPFLLPGALGEAEPSQVGAMDEALRRIRERSTAGKAQVLVAHCFVRDGAVSDSERGLIGTATQIDPEVFQGFDYVALGHLHRPQTVAPNARYSGSLARYSFSEAGHDKVLLEVEVSPGAPHRCVEHPLPCLRGMRRITASLEALRDDARFDECVDDYVELTLSPAVPVGNPLEQLRRRWPHILSFRNDLQTEGAGLSLATTGGDGPRDLENDFLTFEKQFAAGDATPDEILAAFRGLHARVAKEMTE